MGQNHGQLETCPHIDDVDMDEYQYVRRWDKICLDLKKLEVSPIETKQGARLR